MTGLQAVAPAWVSAATVANDTGKPWRSTARALGRMVAAGRVREALMAWRDARFRPRVRRIYQLVQEGEGLAEWPAWMRGGLPQLVENRGAPNRAPRSPRGEGE